MVGLRYVDASAQFVAGEVSSRSLHWSLFRVTWSPFRVGNVNHMLDGNVNNMLDVSILAPWVLSLASPKHPKYHIHATIQSQT